MPDPLAEKEHPMYHAHPALADAVRVELTHQVHSHHGVPGDDFDGVIPHTTRRQRRAARRHD
jgi:hypothetical protein